MELKTPLLHGIYSYGFKNPSEIQSLAVTPIREGRCVVAQAQSGTGKTGAFTIGILDSIDLSSRTTQALILSPTRELADQTFVFFIEIGHRMPGLEVVLLKGGVGVQDSQEAAASLPHVAVATPGRAVDLIQTGFLRCENMKVICLDEADRLLSENFIDQIQSIVSYLPENVQTLLFSATIPEETFTIMSEFIHDPVKILVKAEKLTLEGIRQFYVNAEQRSAKFGTLIDIYGHMSIQKAIIFANTKPAVDELERGLTDAGFQVAAIHGGLSQIDRDRIMKDFRKGMSRVLVSTDLLARGIDVQQVTLVINYELPNDYEDYLHRIGRSGRYGRKGVAINLIDTTERPAITALQEFYQTKIEELPADFAEIVQAANDQFESDEPEGQ
jgi:translation initiation factor 4A